MTANDFRLAFAAVAKTDKDKLEFIRNVLHTYFEVDQITNRKDKK